MAVARAAVSESGLAKLFEEVMEGALGIYCCMSHGLQLPYMT